MKKCNLIFLSLFFLLSLVSGKLFADVIPFDPQIQKGILSNGLTYYLKSNKSQKGKADFYLIYRVGSTLEKEEEHGAASFVQDIILSETKRSSFFLKKKHAREQQIKLIGYTGFDETVYGLSNICLADSFAVDSALLILKSWVGKRQFSDDLIVRQRLLLRRKKRPSTTKQQRVFKEVLLKAFPESKYGIRFPAADFKQIEELSVTDIANFYAKCYRPDLASIVVVGDIDVDEVEGKIARFLGTIPKPETVFESLSDSFKEQDSLTYILMPIKDQSLINLQLCFKQLPYTKEEKKMSDYWKSRFLEQAIATLLTNQLKELSKQPKSFFLEGVLSKGPFLVTKTIESWNVGLLVEEKECLKGLKEVLDEIKKRQQIGFSFSEFEGFKKRFLSDVSTNYLERDHLKNESIVKTIFDYILNAEPLPDLSYTYSFWKRFLPTIRVQDLTTFFRRYSFSIKNSVVIASGPQNATFPNKEQLEQLLSDTTNSTFTVIKEKPILNCKELPQKGSVLSEKYNKKLDANYLTLSNGMHVWLKTTKLKEDEVLLAAYSPGGKSLLDIKDRKEISVLNNCLDVIGLGELSAEELKQKMSEKQVALSRFILNYEEGLSASCKKQKLEQMMQLIYLSLSDIREDTTELTDFLHKKEAIVATRERESLTKFVDTVNHVLYGTYSLKKRLKSKEYAEIDCEKVFRLLKQRFKNLGDLTLFVVGDFEKEQVKILLERYLASIPCSQVKEQAKSLPIKQPSGCVKIHFMEKMSTAKATALLAYSGNCQATQKNKLLMEVFCHVLQKNYNNVFEEGEGVSNAVYVNGSISTFPKNEFGLVINFETPASFSAVFLKFVRDEIEHLTRQPILDTQLRIIKDQLIKNYNEQLKTNRFWITFLKNYDTEKWEPSSDYLSLLEEITPQMVKEFATQLFEQNKCVEVLMLPK